MSRFRRHGVPAASLAAVFVLAFAAYDWVQFRAYMNDTAYFELDWGRYISIFAVSFVAVLVTFFLSAARKTR
ncbi:MAG: hypothetical protein AAGC56_05055 [Pseudomonadota bacterium]